jgi:hypothetical protein
MLHNLDKQLLSRGECRSFQIVSNIWLIQNGVMLSIMPAMRQNGQLCGGTIPAGRLALALSVGAISHRHVDFLPTNSGTASRVA